MSTPAQAHSEPTRKSMLKTSYPEPELLIIQQIARSNGILTRTVDTFIAIHESRMQVLEDFGISISKWRLWILSWILASDQPFSLEDNTDSAFRSIAEQWMWVNSAFPGLDDIYNEIQMVMISCVQAEIDKNPEAYSKDQLTNEEEAKIRLNIYRQHERRYNNPLVSSS